MFLLCWSCNRQLWCSLPHTFSPFLGSAIPWWTVPAGVQTRFTLAACHLDVLCLVSLSASGPSPMPQEPLQPHNPGQPGVNISGDAFTCRRQELVEIPILHMGSPGRHSRGLSEQLCTIAHHGNLNNTHLTSVFHTLSHSPYSLAVVSGNYTFTQLLFLCSALMGSPNSDS